MKFKFSSLLKTCEVERCYESIIQKVIFVWLLWKAVGLCYNLSYSLYVIIFSHCNSLEREEAFCLGWQSKTFSDWSNTFWEAVSAGFTDREIPCYNPWGNFNIIIYYINSFQNFLSKIWHLLQLRKKNAFLFLTHWLPMAHKYMWQQYFPGVPYYMNTCDTNT